MKHIACGEFVKRQTKDSKFSYFEGSFEELESLVSEHFSNQKPGYKDGVVSITVPPKGFVSGIVKLDETSVLTSTFSARRKGESPYLSTVASGIRMKANHVEVILYHRDVIIEDGDTPVDAVWEIVSINARETEKEPITPMAMARNMAGLVGGTKASYTAEQYMESILYWSNKAMAG
jgi:hypothetical protein